MVNIFGGISVWHNILQSYDLTFLCIRFFSRIIHGKNHGFIEWFFWKWVSDRNSGRNRWRFRSARIRIQVLWSAAVFFEILFTNAVRDYIKMFLRNRELRRSSLLWRGVEEKRLPGRFALAKVLLSYFFVAWVLSDNGKNIFRPRGRWYTIFCCHSKKPKQ